MLFLYEKVWISYFLCDDKIVFLVGKMIFSFWKKDFYMFFKSDSAKVPWTFTVVFCWKYSLKHHFFKPFCIKSKKRKLEFALVRWTLKHKKSQKKQKKRNFQKFRSFFIFCTGRLHFNFLKTRKTKSLCGFLNGFLHFRHFSFLSLRGSRHV